MKKSVILALCLGVFISLSVLCTFSSAERIITKEVVRLHVRANSDTKEDQELKLKVRDRIIKESGRLFERTQNAVHAKEVILDNLSGIQEAASDEVRKNGFNYPVKVTYGRSSFPDNVYGDIYMPAGTYNALVVEIGTGEGKNWWCVMFPPLCFVRESCEGIPPESRAVLMENLGEDAYGMISSEKPEIKFKVYELIKKLLN